MRIRANSNPPMAPNIKETIPTFKVPRKPSNKMNPSNDHIDISKESTQTNKLHFAARNRIEELRETINYHNRLYYERNSPIITDEAWDALFDELKQLEIKQQSDVLFKRKNNDFGDVVNDFAKKYPELSANIVRKWLTE